MGRQSKQQLYAPANLQSYQILKITLALCYLVCRKADELRKETHDANNTWQCAFPVYFSTGQRSGYGVAEKQAKPAHPLAHSRSTLYLTYLKGSTWCQLSDGGKDWNSPSAADACAKSWTALVSSNFAKTIVQHPCIFKATGTRCLVLQILSTELKQQQQPRDGGSWTTRFTL